MLVYHSCIQTSVLFYTRPFSEQKETILFPCYDPYAILSYDAPQSCFFFSFAFKFILKILFKSFNIVNQLIVPINLFSLLLSPSLSFSLSLSLSLSFSPSRFRWNIFTFENFAVKIYRFWNLWIYLNRGFLDRLWSYPFTVSVIIS